MNKVSIISIFICTFVINNTIMVVAKLLMYGLTDEDEYLTDFHFDENQAQGVFVNEDGYLGVILSGQIYELEYSESLFEHIKSVLALKTLGFN